MDLEQLGRRIAEQRKFVKHISQEKMAEALNMYQADISALEHARKGSGISDLNKLQTIADYLEISLQELMFGSGKGGRMEQYRQKEMPIKWAGQKAKFTQETRSRLACHYRIGPEDVHPLIYYCGSYVIYILKEDQISPIGKGQYFGYSKIHYLVMFENDIIGAADVDLLPLFYFIHQPSFTRLQVMVDRNKLDVTDVLRTLNPYIPLLQFTDDPVKIQEYQEKVLNRMNQLMSIKDHENILLVENLYVLEECRRKGICHMILDTIHQTLQTETVWLNMEPVNYDHPLYLETASCVPPVYSRQDIQKISLNSGIAEMMGFTVDPDGWHRQIADIIDKDHSEVRNVRIRKTAFHLSPGLQNLLKNDGELIEMGRALQVMAQTSEDDESLDSFTFRYRKQDGEILVEIPSDSDENLLGLLTRDFEIKLTMSTTSIAGQEIVDISQYNWINEEDLEDECPYLMKIVLAHLEDTLDPPKL